METQFFEKFFVLPLMSIGIILLSFGLFYQTLFAESQICSAPTLTRDLSLGSRGNDVTQLQIFLVNRGFLAPDNTTGLFGRMTEAAIQKYQISRGIVSSGIPETTGFGNVGPSTRIAIMSTCNSVNGNQPSDTSVGTTTTPLLTRNLSRGMRGDDVVLLQTYLKRLGFYKKSSRITDTYGVSTLQAVKKFQRNRKIVTRSSSEYGSVWQKTRTALLSAIADTPDPTKVPHTSKKRSGGGGGSSPKPTTPIRPPTTPTPTPTITTSTPTPSATTTATTTPTPITTTPPLPRPTISISAPAVSFTVVPTSVAYNGTVTITWGSSGLSCMASGDTAWNGLKSPTGSITTGPLIANKTFALSCSSGASGTGVRSATSTKTVTVASAPVSVPPVTLSLSAGSMSIPYNASTTLTWNSTNATSCTAEDGWVGAKGLSGSAVSTGKLVVTKTFTLSCTGSSGIIRRSVTVTVGAPPTLLPSINSFTVGAPRIISGNNTTLSWNSTNTTGCTASGDWTGPKATTSSAVSTGILTTAKTYTYTLVCTGPGGSTLPQSKTVAVTAPAITPMAPTIISGPLKRSDAPFSIRGARKLSEWYANYQEFNSNRVLWTYVGASLIPQATPKGIPVQCTVPYWVPETHLDKEKMTCTQGDGTYKSFDGISGLTLRRPDINSEEWYAYQLQEVKKLVDAGCTSFQQDTPTLNGATVHAGGCYSQGSMDKFRTYLAGAELSNSDIINLTKTGGALRNQFIDFQKKSTRSYLERLFGDIRSYTKSKNPSVNTLFSGNMINYSAMDIVPNQLDFLVSEAYSSSDYTSSGDLNRIVAASSTISTLRRIERVGNILSKNRGYRVTNPIVNAVTFPTGDIWLNQRSIASTYALGLVPIAPFDVFYVPVSGTSARFDGNPIDFSNFFKVARNNQPIFDDYVADHSVLPISPSDLPKANYFESQGDSIENYSKVIPFQSYGTVTKVDTTTYPDRTTIWWSKMKQPEFLNPGGVRTTSGTYVNATNYAVNIGDNSYTLMGRSGVGAIYLPAGLGSTISIGDRVFFDIEKIEPSLVSGQDRGYFITIRKNISNPNKKVVHFVNWRDTTAPLSLYLKKSDFGIPPTKIITSSNPTQTPINPIDLGNYYIYPIENVAWAILVP